MTIVKASGEEEAFSEKKFRQSLLNSGATPMEADLVHEKVLQKLKTGSSTHRLFRLAFSELKKIRGGLASRYNLKKAIMELGPSGFPFEKYISELFACEGYSVRQGEIVKGACVDHEVDVVAEKDNQHFMVECKFHNQAGTKSDIKVALYIQARFEDVERAWKRRSGHSTKFHQAWLVTNTKLTTDAVQYAECVGMKAIGWDYPRGKGLEKWIDATGLHPITCLTTLGESQKQELLANGVLLCKDLIENKKVLHSLGYSASLKHTVLEEIHHLCHLS